MEEIIEMLREANESTAVPLDLPSEDELVEVEEQILLPLPYELRCFLLEASDVICGTREPVTVADPRSHTYLPEVTSQAWEEGMSREFIAICAYPDGYAYIAQDGKVGLWTYADGETGKEWETFWHWVQEEWLP